MVMWDWMPSQSGLARSSPLDIALSGDAARRTRAHYSRIMNDTATIRIDVRPVAEEIKPQVPVTREAATFWLKGCTRCGGDLVSESDMHETYVTCMQCGFYPSDSMGTALS